MLPTCKISAPAAFFLGLILFLAILQLGQAWQPAYAAPLAHSPSIDAQNALTKFNKTAGNGTSSNGQSEALLVAEVLLLLVVGRVLGEGMQRIGQPALMGTLLAGIILGPSLFGWLWPAAQHFLFPKDEAQKGMIDGLSQIGVLMLLLLTGMETDLKLVKISGTSALIVALCGIAFPFACGYLLGQFGPTLIFADSGTGSRLVPSLFLGTALSISSIKIVAMVVREMHFMRRNLGQIIVAAAIMEDTCGWVIIAITFGIAGQGSSGAGPKGIDWWDLAKSVTGVALFLVFCFTWGRWLVFSANSLGKRQFPKRFRRDHGHHSNHGRVGGDHPVSGSAHGAGCIHGRRADWGVDLFSPITSKASCAA